LTLVHVGPELVNHGLIDDIALLDIDSVDAGQVVQNGRAGAERQTCYDCKNARDGAITK